MSKMSLTEATVLALQGKLVENKPNKHLRKKQENIDINVDDNTNVSVGETETIVDTTDATIIVDKKEDEFVPETSDGIMADSGLPIEAPVDTVEVPVEGDDTIIPEDVVGEQPSELPEVNDEISTENNDDTASEFDESKKVEARERTTKDVFVVQGNYGQGWEDLVEEDDRKEAKERLKEYNENETEYAHRLITRRVKKESKECDECENGICECNKKTESVIESGNLSDYTDDIRTCINSATNYLDPSDVEELVDFIKAELQDLQTNYFDEMEYMDESKKVETRERTTKECNKCENGVCECNKKTENKKLQEWIKDEYDLKLFLAYEIGNKNPDLKEYINIDNPENNELVNYIYSQIDSTIDYAIDTALENIDLKQFTKIEENINIEISEDGKEVEVTTDEGEIVETKDETPDDIDRPTVDTDDSDNDIDVDVDAPIDVINDDTLEENVKLNEETANDILVKIEPRFVIGQDGKHFDQTVFFKVTYKVVKGYLVPIQEEIVGWCWGETTKYDDKSCNLKADYSDNLKTAVDSINNGDTSNYMTIDSLSESKSLNESISAAPFRELMYNCMNDEIEPAETMADRMLSAWSDDDCKWYCETYELVVPYNDFKDENEYYKDVYGQIRDISGQVVDDLEESKQRKIESIKMIEARKNKKFEKVLKENKKLNIKFEKIQLNTESFNKHLAKALKVEKVENARIEENNSKLLLKAKVINENKVKGICFEMNKIKCQEDFTRYTLNEIKSLKYESKTNNTKYTLLTQNKDNILNCKYIIKK